MIVSFAWTAEQVLDGKKDVTRRDWKRGTQAKFIVGSIHDGWNKSPYATGARKICRFKVKSIRREPLKLLTDKNNQAYGLDEIRREVGLWRSPKHFVEFVTNGGKRKFKNGDPVRLEFEVIETFPVDERREEKKGK